MHKKLSEDEKGLLLLLTAGLWVPFLLVFNLLWLLIRAIRQVFAEAEPNLNPSAKDDFLWAGRKLLRLPLLVLLGLLMPVLILPAAMARPLLTRLRSRKPRWEYRAPSA